MAYALSANRTHKKGGQNRGRGAGEEEKIVYALLANKKHKKRVETETVGDRRKKRLCNFVDEKYIRMQVSHDGEALIKGNLNIFPFSEKAEHKQAY